MVPEVSIQINRGLSMLKLHDVMGLIIQYRSLSWAAVLAVALSALQILIPPLSAITVVTANNLFFGWFGGLLLSWGGVMAGMALAYAVGRAIVSPGPDYYAILPPHHLVARYGWMLVFTAALFPWWPLKLLFIGAGIASLPVITLLVGVAGGSLIQTAVIASNGLAIGSQVGLTLLWMVGLWAGYKLVTRREKR